MSPWAPLVCDRFLGFSCFYDFLSSAAQVFYRLSLSWDLSGAFLMIRGIGGFGEEEHRGEVCLPLHLIKGVCRLHDFSLLVLTWITGSGMFVRFLHSAAATLPPRLPSCALWEDVT